MYKKTTCFLVLIYGLLLIAGGTMGYIKACSNASLIAGGGSGLLVVLSSVLLFKGKPLGIWASTTLTGFLSILFAVRFFMTHKPMPGIIALVSAVVLTYLLVQTTQWKKAK